MTIKNYKKQQKKNKIVKDLVYETAQKYFKYYPNPNLKYNKGDNKYQKYIND